jgi:hypothetical protein
VQLEGQSEAELQEEERLAEQREEAILKVKRERAQRLAVKRGLSDTLTATERPRIAGTASLRDAIPLRRGRSSTLQSQASDVVPLRGRASTLGSQSGLPSPRIVAASIRNPSPPLSSPVVSEPSLQSMKLLPAEDSTFSEFVQAPDHSNLPYYFQLELLTIVHQLYNPRSQQQIASSTKIDNETIQVLH